MPTQMEIRVFFTTAAGEMMRGKLAWWFWSNSVSKTENRSREDGGEHKNSLGEIGIAPL